MEYLLVETLYEKCSSSACVDFNVAITSYNNEVMSEFRHYHKSSGTILLILHILVDLDLYGFLSSLSRVRTLSVVVGELPEC